MTPRRAHREQCKEETALEGRLGVILGECKEDLAEAVHGCGEMKSKKEMIRVIKTAEGEIL